MYDLMALAYQANITRVFTFMVAREVSNRTYPQVGVHRRPSRDRRTTRTAPEKMEKNVKIQTYHIGLFARVPRRSCRSTPDGDGTLLDHSLLLYGSNMSNSNAHNHFPLPNLVVGRRRRARIKGGRHLKYPDHTPMTNLLADDARQGRRAAGHARRQHGAAGEPVDALRTVGVVGLQDSDVDASSQCFGRTASSPFCLGGTALADAQTPPPDRAARGGGEGRRHGRGHRAAAAARPISTSPEADGTTALHWAVRQGRRELVDRLLRAGADAQGREPLRRHADLPGLRERQRRRSSNSCSRPASARTPPARRRNRADDRRAHRQRRRRQGAASRTAPPWTRSESWRGQTALMWAAAAGPRRR